MLSDSVGGSQFSLEGHPRPAVVSGVTTFNIGLIFLLIGLMLLISGLVPSHTNRQHQYWEDKSSPSNKEESTKSPFLLITGSLLLLAGIVLTILNRVASSKEDKEFSRYISRKLAPAKLAHNSASFNPLHQNHRKSSSNTMNKEGGHEASQSSSHERPSHSEICIDQEAQSPSQLEAIIEETEGPDRMAKSDEQYWTNDIAPVHVHHASNQISTSQPCVLNQETENGSKHQHRHKNQQHNHHHHHNSRAKN